MVTISEVWFSNHLFFFLKKIKSISSSFLTIMCIFLNKKKSNKSSFEKLLTFKTYSFFENIENNAYQT